MTDVQAGTYAPIDDEPDFDADEQDTESNRGLFLGIVALMVLAAFSGVVYVAYKQGVRQGQRMSPPILTAEPGPVKEKPADPGGFEEPYQDKFVLNDAPEPTEETVLPPPEEPLPRPMLDAGEDLLDEAVAAAEDVTEAPEMDEPPIEMPTLETVPEDLVPVEETGPDLIVPPPSEELATVTGAEGPPSIANGAVEGRIGLEDAASIPQEVEVTRVPSGPDATSGEFVVQVASVPRNDIALEKREEVERRHRDDLNGLSFDIQEADLGSRGTFYRVRIGPFAERGNAVNLCEKLKESGQDCFVARP